MRRFFFFMAALFLLLPVTNSHGFSAKGQDCAKCHKLSKDDAAALLKDLIPNLKVLDIKTSPVAGTWEVDVDAGGRKMPLYVDFSKQHLISQVIISLKDKRNLAQERYEELNKVVLAKEDVAKIPVDDALAMGDKDAKHKVIVFSDPD